MPDPSGSDCRRDHVGGASTISLATGNYNLGLTSTGADDPTTGDLDITNNGPDPINNPTAVTITGSGTTTIDPSGASDRAFAVDSGAALTLSGVTVRNGHPSASSSGSQSGGAIYSAGALTLTNDAFTSNSATTSGGAVADSGTGAVAVTRTAFTSNNGAGAGGAIDLSGATTSVTISGDTFTGNMAPISGAGSGAIHAACSCA